jgi:hypothetical protein
VALLAPIEHIIEHKFSGLPFPRLVMVQAHRLRATLPAGLQAQKRGILRHGSV